jgi:hypothetical protein
LSESGTLGTASLSGLSATYDYNGANALTSISYTHGTATIDYFGYQYDHAGQLTTATSLHTASVTYGYNYRGELTSGAGNDYSFDAAGNPLSFEVGGNEVDFSVVTANEFSDSDEWDYAYDDEGKFGRTPLLKPNHSTPRHHNDTRSAQVPPRTRPLPPSGRRRSPPLRQGGGRHSTPPPRARGPARAPQPLAAPGTPAHRPMGHP